MPHQRPTGRLTLLARIAVIVGGLLVAGCGGSASGSEDQATLTVLGASSLTEALSEYGKEFSGATVRSSFAGSDQLAAQIRQGAPADVFASADTEYPRQLYHEDLVEKPSVFARNRLVVITADDGDVHSLAQLAEPGTKIAIGEASVPVGEYTHEVLARLPAAERQGILANVSSEEPEVTSVLAKVANGAADAGFVYVTDAKSAGGEVRTVRLPERLQPEVAYAVAVVRGSAQPALARRYMAGLLSGGGAAALHRAGFLPP
jgi:molybdate transport system substrate-binding protein